MIVLKAVGMLEDADAGCMLISILSSFGVETAVRAVSRARPPFDRLHRRQVGVRNRVRDRVPTVIYVVENPIFSAWGRSSRSDGTSLSK